MTSVSPGKVLRATVADVTIQIPGAPSALVGRMIQDAGYDATYLSGAVLSASVLALPDVGLMTLTELVQHTAYLTSSVDIPVIVDADTGFGDAINVDRTVFEIERAGAAAIQLEDQELPKRCGHLSGKRVVETDQMCAKLHAAVTARSDPDLVIIARTDARGVNGLDDAINRATRYLEAGADWIFPEALETSDEFETFARAIDAPLVANMTEFGKSPLMTLNDLANMGYAAVLYPVTLLRVAMKAVETTLALVASEGIQSEILDLMQTRQDLYDLLEYDAYEARDTAVKSQYPNDKSQTNSNNQ